MEIKTVSIYEVIRDKAKFSFVFSYHEKEYSFDTTPFFSQDNTNIFFSPIMIGDKALNLGKTDINVDLICTRPNHIPVIWHNISLKLVKLKTKYIYCFGGNTNGVEVNRRNHFRMYVGAYGEAQIGTHSAPVPVIVKDISASGIAFISDEDRDVSKIDSVHILYKDTKLNKKLNIRAQVIRKTKLPDGRFVYGCYLGGEKSEIEQYIQERQRFDLKQKKERERNICRAAI